MIKKITFTLILLCAAIVFVFTACSKSSSSDGSIPQTLRKGDKIVLSTMSPLGFGFFKVTGIGEGQWADAETGNIAESFSQATFQYSVTGPNTATLTSQNYQSRTGRRWNITLNLTFDTATTGSFVLNDVALGTTSSYTTRGSFQIK